MERTTAYKVACDEIQNPHRYQPIARGPLWAFCIVLILVPVAFIWLLKIRFWDKKRV